MVENSEDVENLGLIPLTFDLLEGGFFLFHDELRTVFHFAQHAQNTGVEISLFLFDLLNQHLD